MKKHRFWIAYHKDLDQASFNYRGEMYLTQDLRILVPTKSKFHKKGKIRMIMEGKCTHEQILIANKYIQVG
jgi:hypothetical protein